MCQDKIRQITASILKPVFGHNVTMLVGYGMTIRLVSYINKYNKEVLATLTSLIVGEENFFHY